MTHRRLHIWIVTALAWTTTGALFGVVSTATAQIFVDVTNEAGVFVEHRAVEDAKAMAVGTGAAWLDYDGDGRLDLYVTQGVGANHLFRNNGDGTFTDVAAALGADDAAHAGAGVAVADFDNDGRPDIYLANSDADVLLKNEGGERFVDVSESVGIAGSTSERATGAAWGDFDNDGYLDLYVVSHMNLNGLVFSSRDKLFRNERGERLIDASDLLDPNSVNAYGFAATWTDFDNDGDADLLVVNDCPFGYSSRYRPTLLYRNDGGTGFTEVSRDVGASACRHGMGVAVGDYNADGWMDYFYTNIGERTTLLTNESGTFTDRAEEAGVYVGYNPGHPDGPFKGTYSWGAGFSDVDLDGRLDLYVAAGTLDLTTKPENDPQPNALFLGSGGGTFDAVPEAGGAGSTGRSRTTAFGDYDGDGDQDLVLVDCGQRIYLFRNDTPPGHYLTVQAVGTASNRDGIGARVSVTLGDGSRQHREIRGGSSLGATDERVAHFGLGAFASVDTLTIDWPSGATQTLTNVAGDQRLVVTEVVNTAVEPPGSVQDIAVYPNPGTPPFMIRGADSAVEIYDVAGRLVRRLASGATQWDGSSDSGLRVTPGIYFMRFATGSSSVTRPIAVSL